MKHLSFAIVFCLLGTPAFAEGGGVRFPQVGANTYCQSRIDGMSDQEAMERAINASWDDSIETYGQQDVQNTTRLAELLLKKCGYFFE